MKVNLRGEDEGLAKARPFRVEKEGRVIRSA